MLHNPLYLNPWHFDTAVRLTICKHLQPLYGPDVDPADVPDRDPQRLGSHLPNNAKEVF